MSEATGMPKTLKAAWLWNLCSMILRNFRGRLRKKKRNHFRIKIKIIPLNFLEIRPNKNVFASGTKGEVRNQNHFEMK